MNVGSELKGVAGFATITGFFFGGVAAFRHLPCDPGPEMMGCIPNTLLAMLSFVFFVCIGLAALIACLAIASLRPVGYGMALGAVIVIIGIKALGIL